MGVVDLSEKQKRVVAAAITVFAVTTILGALAAVTLLIARFFSFFAIVFLPVAVAGIGALVCDPYFEFLRTRLHMPRVLALMVMFLTVLVPLGAFGWIFGLLLVRQIADLLAAAPEWWETVRAGLESRWPAVQDYLNSAAGQRLRAVVSENSGSLLQGLQAFLSGTFAAGAGIMQGLGALAGWAISPVYFAFFLLTPSLEAKRLDALLPFLKPERRQDVVFLVEEFVNIVVVFFRGQLVIAFLQGVLYAIGFSLLGLKFGFVIGLLLGLLNVVPYLGAMVGFAVTVPLAYFQPGGGGSMVIGVLAVIAVVQLIESYGLTPKIMGDRTGLHPMVIIIAMFFWGTAFGGIMGMIMAIPLTAFGVVFWRLAKERYIEEWL